MTPLTVVVHAGVIESATVYIDEIPALCIFCMPERDTPARNFIVDDRGWPMPCCDRHYRQALEE